MTDDRPKPSGGYARGTPAFRSGPRQFGQTRALAAVSIRLPHAVHS